MKRNHSPAPLSPGWVTPLRDHLSESLPAGQGLFFA